MSNGYSLHIGIGKTDPEKMSKVTPVYVAERDANGMCKFATEMEYKEVSLMLSGDATKERFMTYMRRMSKKLRPGDTFLITYSGHGGQQAVTDAAEKEPDGKDEKLCLFDSVLVDNELGELWPLFKSGVRIIVATACCHSRSNLKFIDLPADPALVLQEFTVKGFIPPPAQDRYVFEYPTCPEIKASVLHLSACQDGQEAEGGDVYSKFTTLLLKHTPASANYVELIEKIGADSGAGQVPGLGILGVKDLDFIYSKPFSIQ